MQATSSCDEAGFFDRVFEIAEGIYGVITGDVKWRCGAYARKMLSGYVVKLNSQEARADDKTLCRIADLLWSLEAAGGAFFDARGVEELSALRSYCHYHHRELTGRLADENSLEGLGTERPGSTKEYLLAIMRSCKNLRELSLKVLQSGPKNSPEPQELVLCRQQLVAQRSDFAERVRLLEAALQRESMGRVEDREAWRERAARYADEIEQLKIVLQLTKDGLQKAEDKIKELERRRKSPALVEEQAAPLQEACTHKQLLCDLRLDLKDARAEISYYEQEFPLLQEAFEKARARRLAAEARIDREQESAQQKQDAHCRAIAGEVKRLLEVLQLQKIVPEGAIRLSHNPEQLSEQIGKVADHLEAQALLSVSKV